METVITLINAEFSNDKLSIFSSLDLRYCNYTYDIYVMIRLLQVFGETGDVDTLTVPVPSTSPTKLPAGEKLEIIEEEAEASNESENKVRVCV